MSVSIILSEIKAVSFETLSFLSHLKAVKERHGWFGWGQARPSRVGEGKL